MRFDIGRAEHGQPARPMPDYHQWEVMPREVGWLSRAPVVVRNTANLTGCRIGSLAASRGRGSIDKTANFRLPPMSNTTLINLVFC